MTVGTLDLLALGRISVDLYAQEPGATFLDPQTFVKSIGGSPSNVAVAAARLGLRSAVVTAVGADPLGEYTVAKLAALGVETRYVAVREGGRTPVVLVALEDPAEPTITFLREPDAPDTTIDSDAVDEDTVATCRVLWTSGATLAAGSDGPDGDALARAARPSPAHGPGPRPAPEPVVRPRRGHRRRRRARSSSRAS